MSRKSKIDAAKKVKIIEQHLNGELGQKGAAKIWGVNKRSVQDCLVSFDQAIKIELDVHSFFIQAEDSNIPAMLFIFV